MKIVNIYPENAIENKRLVYAMTRGESVSIKDLPADSVIAPQAWCNYEDVDAKGEEKSILAIVADGKVYSTISPTFKREFDAIATIMGEESFTIKIVHGKSKAGREFITCTMPL